MQTRQQPLLQRLVVRVPCCGIEHVTTWHNVYPIHVVLSLDPEISMRVMTSPPVQETLMR